MKEHFDIGSGFTFTLEQLKTGRYLLTEHIEGNEYVHRFSTRLEALEEILSYVKEEENEEM